MLEIDNSKYIDTTELKLFGEVKIENGDTKIKGRNHWVGTGLETLAAFIGTGGGVNYPTSNWYILLGTNTTTATTVTMSDLVNPIRIQPNYNYIYGYYYSGSTTAVSIIYNVLWYSRTVSGTIGEIGLYLTLNGGTYPAGSPGMVSRLSVADNSFTAFTINTSESLSVAWHINLVYV